MRLIWASSPLVLCWWPYLLKADGPKRKLGIPTVIYWLVQQAILQVIERKVNSTFSDNSFGFSSRRNAHGAIKRAQEYYEEGYRIVIDIDMKHFFDTVNLDKLMYHVKKDIKDKMVLTLIRKFLRSGVSIHGQTLPLPTEVGVHQGGNLSPLLSNIYLDQLD